MKIFFCYCFLLLIVFCDLSISQDLCSNIMSDYDQLMLKIKNSKRESLLPDDSNFFLIDYIFKTRPDFEKINILLSKYDGKNIGMYIISAKFCLYREDYNRTLNILSKILKKYPEHQEALFLKKQTLDLISLDKKITSLKDSNEYMLKKAIVFRDLFFPQKTINIIRELLISEESTKLWYEYAKSLIYYSYLVKEFNPIENDPLLKSFVDKMKSSGDTYYVNGAIDENAHKNCNWLAQKIMQEVSQNISFVDSILDKKEKQKSNEIPTDIPLDKKNDFKNYQRGNMIIFKSVDEFNSKAEEFFVRKYISELYILKKDLGEQFYNILKITKNCSINYKHRPIANKFSKKEIIFNLADLFAFFQNNYLMLNNWNGPYIGVPVANPWGENFIFNEDRKLGSFGVLSAGPNCAIENLHKIEGDDVGYFMSYADLEK